MMRRYLAILLGLVLLALVAQNTLAGKGNGKGKPGGGGGDPPPTGTVYFSSEGLVWTMDADGSNKTALPANVGGEPSYALHGGHRWFLQWRATGGVGQLFGVREDGDEGFTVQLTTNPNLRPAGPWYRWSKDDASISWLAAEWASGSVVETGIYVADINFDTAGNVVGLDAQPELPTIDLHRYLMANEGAHDWAPDGTRMVCVYATPQDEIRVTDLVGGGSTVLALGGGPRWSPDGATIAFGAWDGIYTIHPDGSGETRIIYAGSPNGPNARGVGGPRWAPTSNHLIYTRGPRSPWNPEPLEIWRSTASGKEKTNLTADITPGAIAIAWR